MTTHCIDEWLRAEIGSLVAYPIGAVSAETLLHDELGLASSDLLYLQLRIEERIGRPLLTDPDRGPATFGELVDLIAAAESAIV